MAFLLVSDAGEKEIGDAPLFQAVASYQQTPPEERVSIRILRREEDLYITMMTARVSAQSLVEAETDRLALDGHLHIQAVVGAAFAALRGSHGVLAPLHDFRNGASQPLQVAADHLVNPETGVVDPRFAFIFVHHRPLQKFVDARGRFRDQPGAGFFTPSGLLRQIERDDLHRSLKGLPKVGDGLLLPGQDFGLPAIAVSRLLVEAEIVDQEDPPDRCQGEQRLQDLPEAAVRLPDAEVGGVGNEKSGGGREMGAPRPSRSSLRGCPRN